MAVEGGGNKSNANYGNCVRVAMAGSMKKNIYGEGERERSEKEGEIVFFHWMIVKQIFVKRNKKKKKENLFCRL